MTKRENQGCDKRVDSRRVGEFRKEKERNLSEGEDRRKGEEHKRKREKGKRGEKEKERKGPYQD